MKGTPIPLPPTVLVGFDGGLHQTALLDAAAAASRMRGLPLTIVTVVADPVDARAGLLALRRDVQNAVAQAWQRLSRAVEHVRPQMEGRPIEARCLTREEITAGDVSLTRARLLVVGARGRHARPAMGLDSVSRLLFKATGCPVLAVPETGRSPFEAPTGGVVVGIGHDPADIAVARAAFAEAAGRDLGLHLVHAFTPGLDEEGARARARGHLDLTLENAGLGAGSAVATTISRDLPTDALAHYARDAALLVIGTRPGSLCGLVTDSVSRTLLREALCPLLIVPRQAVRRRPPSDDQRPRTTQHPLRLDAEVVSPSVVPGIRRN